MQPLYALKSFLLYIYKKSIFVLFLALMAVSLFHIQPSNLPSDLINSLDLHLLSYSVICGVYLCLIFKMLIWEFITNSKKNWFRIKLDFFSSSNLIFTACVACKNQFRNQIDFLIFQTWYFEIEKKSSDTRYFKNQVEIDRG